VHPEIIKNAQLEHQFAGGEIYFFFAFFANV
jgi:hypothetical protein